MSGKKALRTLAPIVALLAGAPVLRAEESWWRMVRRGTAFGHIHRRSSTAQDGLRTVSIDSVVRMDVVGQNRQEIRTGFRAQLGRDLAPLSFVYRAHYTVHSVVRTGRVREGRLVVESRPGGTKEFPLPPNRWYLFDTELEVLRLLKPGPGRHELTFFDVHENRFEKVSIEVTATKGGHRIRMVDSETAMAVRYDLDPKWESRGTIGIERLSMTLERTTQNEATKIRYLKTDDGYTLTASSNKDLGDIRRVRRAHVRVSWSGSDPKLMRLTDNRQRLVRLERSGSRWVAALELVRSTPRDPAVAPPLNDAERQRFLADTRYVKPSHPAIRTALAGVVGRARLTPLAAVRRLVNWVGKTVKPVMIVETLSGPEVLEKKVGKCVEYSTLFGSMARAAGIPTRMALGQRYVAGRWMGHMWNEVWIGRWIAVDPSHGEVGDSGAALIKYVHSPTVMGTQAVRWQLVDNLKVEVVSFQVDAASFASDLPDGVTGRVWVDLVYGIRVEAPEGYEVATFTQGGTRSASFTRGGTAAYLTSFSRIPGTDAAQLLQLRQRHFKSRFAAHRVVSTGGRRVAGNPAAVLEAVFKRKDGHVTLHEVLVYRGRYAHLFNVYLPGKEPDRALVVGFERLLASVRFLAAGHASASTPR